MAVDDQLAFTRLYRRHWAMLFLTTVRVIGSKEDAEDIIQDVFASLWNRRSELQLTSSLAAYLQTAVKYKAIHYIEKNVNRRQYLDTLNKVAETAAPASPEILLQAKESLRSIQAVIGKMPPKMREVYRLSRQELLTHREIAHRLGISEETVKKHIQNALQLLSTFRDR